MKGLTSKLLIIYIVVMVIFAIPFLYQTYSKTDESIVHLMDQQASLALQFDLSIRRYVADYIRPSMYELTKEEEFYPETMSTSYIARSIFEDVREKFPDYILKFSADNPRNPLNQAGPEEIEIIKMFNDQPELHHWEGQILIDDKKYFAKFSARRMVPSCFRCHGVPEDAPALLVQRYGDKNGFHKKLGEVIGLDTVAIPLAKIIEQRNSAFLKTFIWVGSGIVLFFALSFLITRYIVINRLAEISAHFFKISRSDDYGKIKELTVKGNDEISGLAQSFNTLSKRLKESYLLLNEKVDKRTVALTREIAEHKKSEVRLKQSEEKFRLAFQTSPNSITLTTIDNGIFIDINDAFTRFFGYTRDEIIGKSSLEMDIWENSKDRDRLISGLEQKGIVQNLEARLKGKDGQVIDGIMSAHILDIDNKKFLLATTQDVTLQKQSEKDRLSLEIKLQQAHRMESIGTLAGGIAHDFNNILSGMLGYSELARKNIKTPEKATMNIQQIVKGGQRAAELVQQILTFSRQTEFKKKPLDICFEIKESLKLLRASIPTTIEFDIKLNSKALISGDPTKINQVIMNLCTNGYHSMRETGGILTISSHDIKISEPKKILDTTVIPGNYIFLEFKDTGHGMDKETLSKATEPYFTTKKTGQGTGLGLALVKAIIDEHDGFLDIHSEIQKGTSFSIYLPTISRNAAKQETIVDENKISLNGNEKIMIVDDEEAIREILLNFLGDYGYHISAFKNGVDALKAFKSSSTYYDLIVTDMTMPKLSGKDFVQKIQELNPQIPIVMCTGYSDTMTNEQAIELGIKKLIHKPIENRVLLYEIRKILNNG